MKSKTSYTALLGVTQLELAMLLGVSRPLVALFESGKKSLPATAMMLLAQMLEKVQTAEKATQVATQDQSEAKTQLHLDKLLADNAFKQLLVARKIEALQKKIAAGWRRAQLIDFLDAQRLDGQDKRGLLTQKNQKPAKVGNATQLADLQMQQELLAYEAQLLLTRLETYSMR